MEKIPVLAAIMACTFLLPFSEVAHPDRQIKSGSARGKIESQKEREGS